jgi:hypothetical protein
MGNERANGNSVLFLGHGRVQTRRQHTLELIGDNFYFRKTIFFPLGAIHPSALSMEYRYTPEATLSPRSS